MKTYLKPRTYRHATMLLALLAGVGTLLSYPHWLRRLGSTKSTSLATNAYRTDWLGI